MSANKNKTGTIYYFLCLLGILMQVVLLLSVFNGCVRSLSYDTYHHRRSSDFYSIYEAGHQAMLGKNIYDTEPEIKKVPFHSGYRYLPFTAFVLGIPLNIFSPQSAAFLWLLVQAAMLLLNILLSFRLADKGSNRTEQKLTAVFLWTFFFPLNVEYHMGQFSLLMCSFLFWTYFSLRNSNYKSSCIWWVLSMLLKSFSVLFTPIYFKEKKYKHIIYSGAAVAILTFPYYFIFPEGWHRFKMLNLEVTLGMGGLLYKGNLGAQMFLQYLVHPFLSSDIVFSIGKRAWSAQSLTVTLLTGAAVFAALFVTLFRKPGISTLYCLWLTMFFLIFRDVWENQYVMFIPALVIIYFEKLVPAKLFFPLFFIIALPSAHYFIKDIPEIKFTTIQNFLYYAPKPLAIFIFYIALITRALFKQATR